MITAPDPRWESTSATVHSLGYARAFRSASGSPGARSCRRATEERIAATASAIGVDLDRIERGDDAVAAGLLQHLDGHAVLLSEQREHRLVGIRAELDVRSDLDGPV